MRVLVLLSLLVPWSACIVYAQTCQNGNPATTVSVDLSGKKSWEALHDPQNESFSVCGFPANANMVGFEWSGIDLSPVGVSWCSEVAFDIHGELIFRPAYSERHNAPCNNNYTGGSTSYLQDNGLTFTAGADGCVNIEIYETYNDYNNAKDADITAGTLTFTGCPAGLVLPIELLRFSAKAADDYNLIEWATASELNSAWHVVERSVDGRNQWVEVGRLEGAGTTNEDQSYSLKDYELFPLVYYRLREIAYDGQEQISHVIALERPSEKFRLLRLVPNPSDGHVQLQIVTPEPGSVLIAVYDQAGRQVCREEHELEPGLQQRALNLSQLDNGRYAIVLQKDHETIVESLLISKQKP